MFNRWYLLHTTGGAAWSGRNHSLDEDSAVTAAKRQAQVVSRARERGFIRVVDLARELGVSGMTVRRDLDALADRGLIRRVRGGVVPGAAPLSEDNEANPLAAPVTAAATRVGIVVPDVGYYFGHGNERMPMAPPQVGYSFEKVLAGARQELDRSGAKASLMLSQGRTRENTAEINEDLRQQERQLVIELIESGVSGILFSPNSGTGDSIQDYIGWLEELPVPVVLMERELADNTISPSISSVRSAHEVGVTMAVQHFHRMGHRKIGLIAFYSSQTTSSIVTGWQFVTRDLNINGDWIIRVDDYPDWASPVIVDRLLTELIDDGVTALLCHNDNNAFAILQRLKALGIRVPDAFSLISYDDDFASMCLPPLTAVSPPRAYVGQLSARLLMDRLDISRPSSASHVRVEPRLTIRESVAAPPSR